MNTSEVITRRCRTPSSGPICEQPGRVLRGALSSGVASTLLSAENSNCWQRNIHCETGLVKYKITFKLKETNLEIIVSQDSGKRPEIIINHKRTSRVMDGGDWYGLQAMNLKKLG